MEQGKKQARAGSTQAIPCAQLPGQLPQPATHFLDLGDDIFGMIYGMVDNFPGKKALRHCCAQLWRSPSVNSHVTELLLNVEEYPAVNLADIVMESLEAFPKNAVLRSLRIEDAWDYTSHIFNRALRADAAGAQERLKSVQRVTLRGCNLEDGSTAAYWSLLSDISELVLLECRVHVDFIGVLPITASLKGLTLEFCSFEDPESLAMWLPLLKHFTSLTSLKLNLNVHAHVSNEDYADVDAFETFSNLQELESLYLGGMRLRSLDALLRALPKLRTLGLNGCILPHELHLASSSLRVLELCSVTPDFPELHRDDFPALQALYLHSILLAEGDADQVSKEEKINRIKCLASWLGQQPVQVAKLPGWAGPGIVIKGCTNWPAELSVSALNALAPIKQCLTVAKAFVVRDFNIITQDVLLALCNLASHALCLRVHNCVYGWEVIKLFFVKAVHAMPYLTNLEIQIALVPRDALAALTFAQRAGRHLTIDFRGSDASCADRLEELLDEWSAMELVLPGSLTVGIIT